MHGYGGAVHGWEDSIAELLDSFQWVIGESAMVSQEKVAIVPENLVGEYLENWVDLLRHLNHQIKEHVGHESFKREMILRRDAQVAAMYGLAVAYHGYRPETLLTIENDSRKGVQAPTGVLKVWAFRADRVFAMCDAGACGCGTIPQRQTLPKRAALSA